MKISKQALFLIPIGVAVNFIGGQICILTKLPAYLDAIGTIVVAALCGTLPGVIVGLVSNVLNSLTDPNTLWFGLLNMAFAVLAAYLSKKLWFKNFGLTLLSSLFFAFIGGGIGSVMTWIIYGFDLGTSWVVNLVWIALGSPSGGFPMFLAEFIGEVGVDLFDKVLTVIASYFILKAMPTRFLSKLPLGYIYISDEDKAIEDSAED